MKSTELIKLKKETGVVKVNAFKPLKRISMESINDADEKINKIWAMFENQLQRNFNLMSVIDRQQQVIEQFVAGRYPVNTDVKSHHELPVKEQPYVAGTPVTPMPLNRLRRLSNNHKTLLSNNTRIDGIHNCICLMHVLDCMGGTSKSEPLFEAGGIAVSSSFRIMARLRDAHFVKYTGTNHDGHYALTEIGKDFMDEKLTDRFEYIKRMHPPAN